MYLYLYVYIIYVSMMCLLLYAYIYAYGLVISGKYIYTYLFIGVRCLLLCVFISVSILLLLWSSWWINRFHPNILELSTVAKPLPPQKRETYSWQNQQKNTHRNKNATDPQTQRTPFVFQPRKKSTTGTTPPTRQKKNTIFSEAFGDIISDPVVEWLHRGTPMVWICAASQQGYSDVTPRVLAAFFFSDDSEGLGK